MIKNDLDGWNFFMAVIAYFFLIELSEKNKTTWNSIRRERANNACTILESIKYIRVMGTSLN